MNRKFETSNEEFSRQFNRLAEVGKDLFNEAKLFPTLNNLFKSILFLKENNNILSVTEWYIANTKEDSTRTKSNFALLIALNDLQKDDVLNLTMEDFYAYLEEPGNPILFFSGIVSENELIRNFITYTITIGEESKDTEYGRLSRIATNYLNDDPGNSEL